MGIFKQVAEYLFLKKRDPDAPDSSWLRKMHTINRISIFLFVFCLLVMLVRFLLRR
jgi:hypothetical protein